MTRPAFPWIGLFDLFRIGVGPSSSHTVGPMVAAAGLDPAAPPDRIVVELFGSLALTGKGHATDGAVILGLTGAQPDGIDPDDAALLVEQVRAQRRLALPAPGAAAAHQRHALHGAGGRARRYGADLLFRGRRLRRRRPG